MLFNSYIFIFIFLPITLWGFFYLGKKSPSAGLSWLVFASLFFYAWWEPSFLIVIMCSLAVNYIFGYGLTISIEAFYKKIILLCGLSFNIGLIAYYKYANFLIENINIFVDNHYALKNTALPLAISFFTFQQIAYLVDSYRGLCKERDLIKYCLFITFFPQLIAGPIVHHKEMVPQFQYPRLFIFNRRNLSIGITLFIIGLFKKVILADNLSLFATPVFTAAQQGELLTFFEAWGGALAYTFQLYFDFSGYSDMALGLGLLFGIRLPMNFNSPYKAINIIDFWRRWHITLSTFLRHYLYIPLGGNRKGVIRRYANLMLTMLIGGLWHGAGWTFVIWGALHGAYLIVNHAWQKLMAPFKIDQFHFYRYFAQGLTLICVVVAWVFFRANNTTCAMNILKSMAMVNGMSLPVRLNDSYFATLPLFSGWITFDGFFANNLCYWPKGVAWITMAMLISLALPNSLEILGRQPRLEQKLSITLWQPNKRWAMVIMVAGVLSLLNLGQLSEFIYFQF